MKYEKYLKACELCPRKCKINRVEGQKGFCQAGINVKVNLFSLHFYEEPCISGTKGSGTVFFSSCNLACKFCQNYKISQGERLGDEYSIEELADKFIELQNKGANNINLVTGFMYIPQIVNAVELARNIGLKIPIIYNSSGYESVEALRLLEGIVDVYLPDIKYFDNDLAYKLSGVSNYKENVIEAIKEMYRQVGSPQFNDNELITRGLIIRHLVLPNYLDNSKIVLKYIKDNYDDCLVSVMMQYFPSNNALMIPEIARKINKEEYDEIEDYVFDLDLNGFMQDLEDNEEKYVPNFKI